MVLASFCNELEELLVLDLQGVLDSYREVDLLAGAKINVMPKKRENPERRRAEVIEISADGSLVVKYEDTGEVVNLLGEEVSVRLQWRDGLSIKKNSYNFDAKHKPRNCARHTQPKRKSIDAVDSTQLNTQMVALESFFLDKTSMYILKVTEPNRKHSVWIRKFQVVFFF